MKQSDAIKNVPAYCIRCGGPVEVIELKQKRHQGSGQWRCTTCGYKDGTEWIMLTRVPNNRFYKILQSVRHRLRPRLEREEKAQSEQTCQIITEKGLSGLIELADFPVLGFSTETRLLPSGFGHGTSWSKEHGLGPPVERIDLSYYTQQSQPRDMLTIDNDAIQRYQTIIDHGYLKERLNEPRSIISEWQSLIHNNRQLYPHLLEREQIYQTCNMATVGSLPVINSIISLSTGQEIEWHIKLMQAEIVAAYAWTVLDETVVKVWSVGNVSPHLDKYLAQLVYLEPHSQQTEHTQTSIDQWQNEIFTS